jgi:hypothetical protein
MKPSGSVCASCNACAAVKEEAGQEVYTRQEEGIHLYAAERLLYQFYWSEIRERLSANH